MPPAVAAGPRWGFGWKKNRCKTMQRLPAGSGALLKTKTSKKREVGSSDGHACQCYEMLGESRPRESLATVAGTSRPPRFKQALLESAPMSGDGSP